MRKSLLFAFCVLLSFLMCGCSLEYSEQADEGNFSYAYGQKTAFVTVYRWDGTDEGMTIIIPKEYNGRKIVSVGGFFGRGLPMPFYVDISGYFPEDIRWVTLQEADVSDEIKELNFTLVLPKHMEDIHIADSKWLADEGGKIIEYKVFVNIEYANKS